MYFEQNISGPIFISDAPDVVISSANSDTIHVVITVDDSSWDMDLCPSVQEDSFKAVIKLKDVLSSVAGKPDFLGEASSVVPKISINADNGTEPAILMEFQAFYGNADGKIPSELKRHWLSWREQISITMRDAREFLTFASGLKLLGWSSGTYSAKAKLFVHGSDPVETTIAEGTLEDDCKYFKLDYSSAKLCESAGVDITRLMAIDCYFVLDGKDSGGTNAHLASYPLRLIISGANDSRLKEFIFCNSLGVEDRVISFGINARSVKGESRVFTSDGTSHELDNSGIESFQVRSGNISSARGAALWSDFLKASGRYLTSGGKVTEIIVEEWDTDITEGELGNVSFKYHLSRTDRGRWFEDSESLGNYDPLEKFGALSVAGPEVATPPSEDLFFLKTRLDEFPLVELGDDFLFLVQSKSSYSWNSASLKSLKDWLLKNINVEALQLWCGPWDNYSEAVSKYALSAGAGKNLYDLIAILNRVCQNNFNSLTNKILAETSARKTADSNLQTGIDNVNSLIPSVASTTNQLADKEFVNSSIASSTATFRGTFETINDLPTSSVKKNDYAFVIAVSNGNPEYQRYKYNGEAWAFEYTLNNSSFTSKQWAAITSGITTDKVSSYDTHIFNKGNPHGVTKAQVGLGSVENVALSTWKGSTNITTLGVITTGTWQGTKIANAYLANSSITIGTTKFNLGDAKTAIEGLTSLLFSGASGALTYNKTDKYYSLADNLVVNGILASGTSGTGGAAGYSQVEWADIQKMTGSVSGSLASAYAVKESYSALNTIVSKKADKITLDAVTKKVISLENKYTAVTTDIANHIGNTTVHITSAERTAWNNKQAAISDLATIRSNAATAYGWGDHSKAGYITGITKAMVEGVLTGNITSHTHSYLPLSGGAMANTNKVTNLNAELLDGYHKIDILRKKYGSTSIISLNDVVADGIDFTSWGYADAANINNQPGGDGVASAAGVVSFGTGYPFQIYSDYNDTNKLFYRSFYINTGWKAWRQFAFLDSNVASASKWANARTITLTGSVTGSVSIDGSDNVSLDTTTNHTHTFASLTSKPTTLSGYGITDASRIFRYTIPASGNKGVRITFTAYEPVKITVSGSNQNAQLVLIGSGYGQGGFIRNNFTEVVPSDGAYTWCVSNDYAFSVEIFSNRLDRDFVTVESPSPVTFTAISALSTNAAYRHLLTTANYKFYALPLTGGTISGSASTLLEFNSTSNYECGVRFLMSDVTKGWVGYTPSKGTNLYVYADRSAGDGNAHTLGIKANGNAYVDSFAIFHSGNANKIDISWNCHTINSMCVSSPYSDVFDANNPDRWINSNYGSIGKKYSNMPDGWEFGTVLTIGQQGYRGINGDLNAQFVWDVQHSEDINNPGRLWWRTKSTRTGWRNWKEIYHAGNANNTSTDWTCKSLVANGKITAYNQLQFTSNDNCYISAGPEKESGALIFKTRNSHRLIITADGKVGIGTDSPAEKLHVAGNVYLGGSAKMEGDYPLITTFIRNFKSASTSSWSRAILGFRVDDRDAFRIASYGSSYTPGAKNNKITYTYLGFADYNGLNLRISDTSLTWGNNAIYHAGNCNLPTVPWTCSSLVSTNDVTAKTGLYGRYLEFSNITSSAGHGGFIDFHFNGNTADYTSRIIEDASGQITIKAGVLNIGTSAKGFLYMLRPSSNYIWANTAGGEICIGTADGGETSALNSGITIIGKRVYIGGTNSGSNALNVKGAIHATTGLYTDGYISAKQASASSDRRLKKDFCKIDNALKYVLKTHYTRFRWKDDNKESIGIIAQEEQNREYGFLVQNNEKIGHLTYDYAASTALLGAAIQEEDSKVEKLKKRVAELEKELSNLKRKWQH